VIVYLATYLLPVASAVVRDGAVAVDGGKIISCGAREHVLAEVGDRVDVRDLGRAAILPGLINAHTHLELSWARSTALPGGDYATWLAALLEQRPAVEPQQSREAALAALARLAARGTVAVGDVANESWIVPLIARSGLHGTIFLELLGLRPSGAEALLATAIERLDALVAEPDVAAASNRLKLVLTPHAPHTVSVALLRALAGRAAAADQPLSIHVAESEAESALLADGTGPLAALFDAREFRDTGWRPPGLSPVEQLDRAGALTERTLAVHCVHVGGRDRSRLRSRGVTVVTCPRSNERLGPGRAPLLELLRAGICVAVGTDSLASAPDLDLFAEMAALRRLYPALSPATVVRMATLNGAIALGIDDRLGSIERSKLDRLVVLPLGANDEDPLERCCALPETVFPLAEAPWQATR